MNKLDNEPRYVISVAARMLGIRDYTLRYYEKVGIIEPLRSRGKNRLYSENDITRLKQVKTLMDELGINLAGADVVLRMAQQVTELQHRLEEMELELGELRQKEL